MNTEGDALSTTLLGERDWSKGLILFLTLTDFHRYWRSYYMSGLYSYVSFKQLMGYSVYVLISLELVYNTS